MVLRRLVNDDGQSIAITRQQILDNWPDGTEREEIEEVISALAEAEIIDQEGSYLNIGSNLLASLLNDVLKEDDSEESELEALISERYHAFPTTLLYLTASELSNIEPILSKLILTSEEFEFVQKSRRQLARKRRRRWIVLVTFGTMLTLLSTIAIIGWGQANVQANNAEKESARANAEADRAKDESARANAEAARANMLADSARNQTLIAQQNEQIAREEKRKADLYADSLEREQERLVIAQDSINKLLIKVSERAHIAEVEKEKAQESERKAINLRRVADQEKARADSSRLQAEKFRNVLLSTVVANKSLSSPPGRKSDTMRIMMARVAYNIDTVDRTGETANPTIYSALYHGYKRFATDENFNSKTVGENPIQELEYFPETSTLAVTTGFEMHSINFFEDQLASQYHLTSATQTSNKYTQRINKMQYSDENTVVIAAVNSVHIVNTEKDDKREFPTPNKDKVLDIIPFQNDGNFLVLTSEGDLYELDVISGRYTSIPGTKDVSHVAYLQQPNILIYVSRDDKLHLMNFNTDVHASWDTRPNLAKLAVHEVKMSNVVKVFIVFGYLNGVVRVGLSDHKELQAHDGSNQDSMRSLRMIQNVLSSNVHKGFISDVDFAEGMDQMIIASGDGTASIWDIETWYANPSGYQPIILDDHEGWVTACILNREQNIAFTGTRDGKVKFWLLDPSYFADKICEALDGRSFNPREWGIYVGAGVKYQDQICK